MTTTRKAHPAAGSDTRRRDVLSVRCVSKSYSQGGSGWRCMLSALAYPQRTPNEIEKPSVFHALKNVSFDLPEGEALGILGLNGSGKSTLLQIVSGTLQPNSGEVRANSRISALLELGSGFNPDFSGRENVHLYASVLGLSRKEIEDNWDAILSFADIGKFIEQPVKTYSSGMLMRLAFATAIHVNPGILIIDEALAVGDVRFQAKCFRFLESFREGGGTLLFVSHDVGAIARLCTQALLLHHGEVHATGEPAPVINEYSKIVSGDPLPAKRPRSAKSPPTLPSQQKPSKEVNQTRESYLLAERAMDDESRGEFAYGGTLGEILDFEALNESGEPNSSFLSGETCVIRFTARADSPITAPIYAMIIRDAKGQNVYGHNTLFADIDTKDLAPGEQAQVTFRLPLNLGAGEFLVSLGFTRYEDQRLQVIHRRYDVMQLSIRNADGSVGIANCFSSIELNESRQQ